MEDRESSEFEKASSSQAGTSLVGELWWFFRNNRKWWLLPILLVLLFFGGVMLLSGTAVGPLLYTLF